MTINSILTELHSHQSSAVLAGQKRFGIANETGLGVSVPILRAMAKKIGKSQPLSIELWNTNIHEARLLASMIGVPTEITEKQFDDWTTDFDSWDICDMTCSNLFDKTPFVVDKIFEYALRKEEFVKRTAFALMATYAVHAKNVNNEIFEQFLPLIEREACDDRNFVKKAVNWGLRQIGKRNLYLYEKANECAIQVAKQSSKSAQWIAKDALREFSEEKIIERIKQKSV